MKKANLIYILPNFFTASSIFIGVISIVEASKGHFVLASWLILLALIFDGLDGRVARMTNTTSQFGVEFDSLADIISFGIAPAMLLYFFIGHEFGRFGILVSALYVIFGAIRLARFNITSEEQTIFFLGIPTTIAGCFLATTLINGHHIIFQATHMFGLLSIVGILAYLMTSTVPFPTFKHLKKKCAILVALFAGGFIITMGLIKVLLLFFILYFFLSFHHFIRIKIIKKQ